MLQQCPVPRKELIGKIILLGVMEDEKVLPKLQHFFN